MSEQTQIQWCDSTINPIMGCGGCELFLPPGEICERIDREQLAARTPGWADGTAYELFADLIAENWKELIGQFGEALPGHVNAVTTTNMYHLREQAEARVRDRLGSQAGKLMRHVVEQSVTCYAAKLHLNRARSLVKPDRKVNVGYAPAFETVSRFPGRMFEAANFADLLGVDRPSKSWLDGLPRLIFLSDMGDALSRREDFAYVDQELETIRTAAGDRHLWLWLTKRPNLMRQFADSMGGLPRNFCAMTTVTSSDTLRRVDDLRNVRANVRGLSIEPLRGPVASQLDLSDIDWVIVGGESGALQNVTLCRLEWILDVIEVCQRQGVACFVKQLGRAPIRDGERLMLSDMHGGNWDEWDNDLHVREMPAYFREYRARELHQLGFEHTRS